MKQIFRIFTLIAVAMLTAGQAWAGTTADLGFIKRGTVTGGDLMFYKEATCETKISPNSNLYSSDLTDGKVYIKATPDWNYTGIGVTITAQVSTSSSPAEARSITRGSTAPGIGQAITVSPVSDKPGIYSFTMPTDGSNANVSATFKEKPYLGDGTNAHISYYSYDAQGNRVTSNTGDDGHPRVYILDGTEEELGEGNENPTWYVCNTTDLSYTSTLILNGDVHLILADNAKMTMDVVNGPAIFGYSGDFYIYGQSDGENIGKLIATSDATGFDFTQGKLYVNGGQVEAIGSSNGILCNGATINGGQLKATGFTGICSRSVNSNSANITITGGQVTAIGNNNGIIANNNVTISGGQVTATGSGTNGYGILSLQGSVTISGGQVEASSTKGYGIISLQGGVTISGGQVTATGSDTNYGIYTQDIILGWTNANDYIKASKYYGNLKTADGKRFVAYTPGATESDPMIATAIVSGNVIDPTTLNGKTLKPIDGYTVTVGENISLMDGTTAKTPDFTIGTTPYYIYKASTEQNPVTVTLSYGGTDFVTVGGLPEGTTLNAVANQPMQRSFAMPAEDLALTATAVTDLTLSSTSAEYNGAAQTIGIKFGNDAFSSDNYSLGYEIATAFDGETSAPTTFEAATEAKNVGTYRLTLTGLGQYIGTATMAELFTITPATLTGVTASVASVLTYTGNALSPEVTVSYPNGDETKAIDAADYTVGYQKQTSTDPVVYEEVSEVKGIGTYVAVVTAVTGGNCTFDAVTSNSFEVKYTDGTITQDENGFSVDLTDGENTNPLPFNGKVKDLDYRRTLSGPGSGETGDTKINGNAVNLFTVCLPFAPKTGTGVKYYTLNSVNDKTLKFIEITGNPIAFTPYMVAVTSNVTDFKEQCNDVSFNTDDAITSKTVTSTNNKIFTFTGTLTGLTSTDAAAAAGTGMVTYILQHQAKWGKVVSGDAKVKIPPFRAFITGPDVTVSGARELDSSFEGEDDATGIQNILTVDRDGTERWYDLNGRRIDQPTKKGIYINNGKKVIKK